VILLVRLVMVLPPTNAQVAPMEVLFCSINVNRVMHPVHAAVMLRIFAFLVSMGTTCSLVAQNAIRAILAALRVSILPPNAWIVLLDNFLTVLSVRVAPEVAARAPVIVREIACLVWKDFSWLVVLVIRVLLSLSATISPALWLPLPLATVVLRVISCRTISVLSVL